MEYEFMLSVLQIVAGISFISKLQNLNERFKF